MRLDAYFRMPSFHEYFCAIFVIIINMKYCCWITTVLILLITTNHNAPTKSKTIHVKTVLQVTAMTAAEAKQQK